MCDVCSGVPHDASAQEHAGVVCHQLVDCSVGRYVNEEDLTFFKDHIEKNVEVEGATAWAPLMSRDFTTFTYTAWRRILPVSDSAQRGLRLFDFILHDP